MPPADLAVLVPVLGRPNRVRPTIQAFTIATPHPFRLLFIASPDDERERQALADNKADTLIAGGNYAQKIRAGIQATSEPLIFLGADDLEPKPGWLEAAKTRITGDIQVVGVNDLCSTRVRTGQHATHFLMTRAYAEQPTIDGQPGPLCEDYDHSFCDDELVATARKRGVLAFATDSIVEHLHPDNGRAVWDETYEKGRARMHLDRRLFLRRQHLWAQQT
jgi:hypothetical protein